MVVIIATLSDETLCCTKAFDRHMSESRSPAASQLGIQGDTMVVGESISGNRSLIPNRGELDIGGAERQMSRLRTSILGATPAYSAILA